jgi:hypothetical protein
MSARSWGEPRSLLSSMSPSRETTVTGCPSHSASIRVCHCALCRAGANLDHVEHEYLGVPGHDLGESMHHDLALGQPRGNGLSLNEPVRRERSVDRGQNGRRARRSISMVARGRAWMDIAIPPQTA